MKTYRLRLRPLSAWVSPWHADSLFGSICWKYRLMAGEQALGAWLDRFRDGDPVLVLSDAFPANRMPTPVGLRAKSSANGRKKPPLWIPEATFKQWLRDPSTVLMADLPEDFKFERRGRLRAAIDRQTELSEGGGQLFEITEEDFPVGAQRVFSLFLRTNEALDAIVDCLRLLGLAGFGKKSSSGFGAFEIDGQPEPCPWLDRTEDANGFVALSHFVPAAGDPTDGRWRLHVKYPKFHGSIVEHPFKGTLLTVAPGSVFYTAGPPREFYGRTIAVPRDQVPDARHYGLCLTAPAVVRLAEKGASSG